MYNAQLAALRLRLLLRAAAVSLCLVASHVTAGDGFILIDHTGNYRPFLFFRDDLGGVWNEAQGDWSLSWSSPYLTLKKGGLSAVPLNVGSVSVPTDTGTINYNFGSVTAYFMRLGGSYTVGGVGSYFVSLNPSLSSPDRWWNRIEDGKLRSSVPSQESAFVWQCGANTHTLYVIPSTLELTSADFAAFPWGWWGNISAFTWDSSFVITSLNIGGTDNPAFPPDIPVNPLTGQPYAPGTFQWNYDTQNGRWTQYNKWTDASAPPSVALGPSGQWQYGRRPGGNLFNPDPEGFEWWWDGSLFGDVNLPPAGGVDQGDPWNGSNNTAPLDSSTLALLSSIEQNTGRSKTELMGMSTAIAGFRSGMQQGLSDLTAEVVANRQLLWSCLDGHHKYLEPRVDGILQRVTEVAQYQQDIISELSTGFGGVSGALSGIGSGVDMVSANTASLVALQESLNGTVSGGMADLSSLVSSAVDGLDRLEGKLISIDNLTSLQLDLWGQYITDWEAGENQTLERLQHIVDVADSLKEYGRLTEEDNIWWRVERIRWVARDEQAATDRAETNEKLSDLISTVANIPPPDVPEVDVSGIESRLDSALSGQSGAASTLEGVRSGVSSLGVDLQTVKMRLSSMDNALNTRVDVAEVGPLTLSDVQTDFRDTMLGKLQALWDKLVSHESVVKNRHKFGLLGNGRTANKVWLNTSIQFQGYDPWEIKIDFNESQHSWFSQHRNIIRTVEQWGIWMLCLMLCYRELKGV